MQFKARSLTLVPLLRMRIRDERNVSWTGDPDFLGLNSHSLSFIHSFTHYFSKCSLSACNVPGPMVGNRDTVVHQTRTLPSWTMEPNKVLESLIPDLCGCSEKKGAVKQSFQKTKRKRKLKG